MVSEQGALLELILINAAMDESHTGGDFLWLKGKSSYY